MFFKSFQKYFSYYYIQFTNWLSAREEQLPACEGANKTHVLRLTLFSIFSDLE